MFHGELMNDVVQTKKKRQLEIHGVWMMLLVVTTKVFVKLIYIKSLVVSGSESVWW